MLKKYAEAFHAGPGWKFLTGKKEDVKLLRKKFGDTEAVVNHRPNHNVGNDRTGEWWIANALDNPKFTATIIGGWMDPNFKGDPEAKSYAEAPRPTPLSQAETISRTSAPPATPARTPWAARSAA